MNNKREIKEMISSKFYQMFKFISQYKYEISENVPDNLKCGKCRNILINAYFVQCGCSYCYDCLNEILNNGVENCPGKTENCKDELLSNNEFDQIRNAEISNVVMKCPEEMCSYECTIISMEEHLRICEKKSVKCPLVDVSCDGKKSAREMLNDHCQSADFNHSEILIKMIDNMRNEIDILKDNDEKNQLKIENLEINLKSKNEIIDKINEEIESIKIEKETVKQEFDSFKENLKSKIEEIDDKVNRDNKIGKEEDKRECDKINEKLERKTKEIFVEIQKEKRERIKSTSDETKSINETTMKTNNKLEMIETRINKVNKFLELKYPLILWTIDELHDKRMNSEWILSEYFTGIIKQYKLQLSFYADGNSADIYGKGCTIVLRVCPDAEGEFSQWPFTADVRIKLMSKTNPNISKSITKYCKINKPKYLSGKWSESFDYLYCDLTKHGEKLDDCFIVECFIDFK